VTAPTPVPFDPADPVDIAAMRAAIASLGASRFLGIEGTTDTFEGTFHDSMTARDVLALTARYATLRAALTGPPAAPTGKAPADDRRITESLTVTVTGPTPDVVAGVVAAIGNAVHETAITASASTIHVQVVDPDGRVLVNVDAR
jgi:hypothetical protein